MISSLQPTKRYFLALFAISSILLGVFTLVVYQHSLINKNSTDEVIHGYRELRAARRAMIHAMDMANNEQDYVLTHKSQYLAAYKDVLGKLQDNIADLKTEITGTSEQEQNALAILQNLDRLQKLSAAHIQALRQNPSRISPANSYVLKTYTDDTQQALADLRASFKVFSQIEDHVLEKRAGLATTVQKDYMLTLSIGTALGLGALILANIIIFSLIGRNSRAEEKFKKSEEIFSTIINGLNDGLFDYNIEQGTIYYSSYRTLLGYEDEELGKTHDMFDFLLHPDDDAAAREVLRQYIEHEIPTYNNVFRLRHKKGHWIWLMSRGVGIWDKDGKIQRLIGSHTDITARKEREEDLRFLAMENERQRDELSTSKDSAEAANQAKSDFLATMSHEIRTPLNAVVGLARLLLAAPLDNKQHEMVETLKVNADILLRLVNDLLDLSRIEAGQMQLESRNFQLDDLFKVVHAMFDTQAAAKKIHLSVTNHIEHADFIGDPSRLQQILVNLTGNALKFTDRGSVLITATSEPIDDTEARIHIEVADTGIGVSEEKLATIFEKFTQADQTISRRFGGSGLGLAICRSLARLMGGDITASSTVNVGSVFTVTLPLKIGQPVKSATPSPVTHVRSAHPVKTGGRVLIVEDYAPNVMVVTMLLEDMGYTTDVARNGADAIAKLQQQTSPYIAVLMDVQMHGMDGLETTRRIRLMEAEKGFSRQLIIGLTAHALAGDRDRCVDAGMDDYMSKPINPDLLAQKLGALQKAA